MTTKAKQPVDWTPMKAGYVSGHLSLRELAERHGVTYTSLRKRAQREGWSRERRAHSQRVVTELTTKTVAARVSLIVDWNAKDLRVAKVLRAKLSRRLVAIRDDSDDPNDGLAELRAIAAAAESTQRMARLALGAPTEHIGISRKEPDPNGPTLRDWYATVEELEAERGGDSDGDGAGGEQSVPKGGR